MRNIAKATGRGQQNDTKTFNRYSNGAVHSKLLHLTIHSIKEELVTPP